MLGESLEAPRDLGVYVRRLKEEELRGESGHPGEQRSGVRLLGTQHESSGFIRVRDFGDAKRSIDRARDRLPCGKPTIEVLLEVFGRAFGMAVLASRGQSERRV